MPNQMTEGWLHLLLGLANLERAEHAETLIENAAQLLSQGASEIVKSLSQKSLEESAAVLPLEIFSLISLKLVQGISNIQGFQQEDIFQLYRNRLEAIVDQPTVFSFRMRDADYNNRQPTSTSGRATEPTSGASGWSTRKSKQYNKHCSCSPGSSAPPRTRATLASRTTPCFQIQ